MCQFGAKHTANEIMFENNLLGLSNYYIKNRNFWARIRRRLSLFDFVTQTNTSQHNGKMCNDDDCNTDCMVLINHAFDQMFHTRTWMIIGIKTQNSIQCDSFTSKLSSHASSLVLFLNEFSANFIKSGNLSSNYRLV